MSLSREQLGAALWGALHRQFVEVGIENVDESGNLKDVLDQTLLALGVAYGDLADGVIADGDEHKALTVARYYGLSAVYDAIAASQDWVDVSVDGPSTSLKRSQALANIEKALTRAKADAAPFIETGASSWGFGSFSLDFIEPCVTE